MHKGIYGYIWQHSKRQQLVITLITVASFPFLYASLELPKVIVNDALSGADIEKVLLGIELGPIGYLLGLCGILLVLLFANAGFLMAINTYKNLTSERMTRRLRYMAYQRILRFPVPHFQRVSQGELSTMLAGEVELIREFFADAIALPLFQGGQLAVIITFMFMQDPILGAASITLIPLQIYIIPKLQRKINQYNKERVARARKLSGRVGESVAGIRDIRTSDTAVYSQADFSKHLEGLFKVRYKLFRTKYFMKALNVFMLKLTPLLFYAVGGLLIILPDQDMTVGALVAAIAAYNNMTTPWKELLKYYQRRGDARIKYEQLVLSFELASLLDEKTLELDPSERQRLEGGFALENVTVADDDGSQPLDGVSFTVEPGKRLAVVADAVGRDRLAQVMTGLLAPSGGRIVLGGRPMTSLSPTTISANVAYVGSESYIFDGSVEYNATFGLQHKIPGESDSYDKVEAISSGNCPFDATQDWTDLDAAGCKDRQELESRWYEIVEALELDDVIFQHALNSRVDEDRSPQLPDELLDARRRIVARLDSDPDLGEYVRRFDFESYNQSAPVAVNLIFGEATDDRLALANFGHHPFIREILREADLEACFQSAGFDVARELVDIFGDQDAEQGLLQQFSFVDVPTLKKLALIVARGSDDSSKLTEEDVAELISLTGRLSVERHRMGQIDKDLQARIVEARALFHERLPESLKDAIAVYDPDSFNPRLSIRRNLVMGHNNQQRPNSEQKINEIIREALKETGVYKDVIIAGMQVEVGIGGQRLAVAARQSLALGRAILTRPAILVVNDALGGHDRETRDRICRKIGTLLPDTTLIWIDSEMPKAELFDSVLVLRDGKLDQRLVGTAGERGTVEELPEKEGETPQAIRAEAAALAKVPLFKQIRSNNLKLLAFGSKRVKFRRGEVLLHQNDIGETAFVVLSGEVDILLDMDTAGERLLARSGRYEPVGEISLLATVPRTASARAFSEVEALEIDKQVFLQIVESDAQVAANAARIAAERLANTLRGLQKAA